MISDKVKCWNSTYLRPADEDLQDRRLSSLISLMLSSQTKDPVTHEATMKLRHALKGGLCLEGILSATDDEIKVMRYSIHGGRD